MLIGFISRQNHPCAREAVIYTQATIRLITFSSEIIGRADRPEEAKREGCQAFGKTRISCHSGFWPSLDSQIAVQ